MKRIVLFLIAITLCLLILSGCAEMDYKGPLSCVSRIGNDGVVALMDMTEEAQRKLIDALNSGEWVNDVTNCGHDYEFETEKETIRYHSACGTFIDITNGRSLTLSEEKKNAINELLGAGKDNTDDIEDSGYETTVKMLQFAWSGYGISTKTISTCDLAYSIIDALAAMPETGKTAEKISDDILDEDMNQPPVDPGTMWIEVGSKIYRLDPDLTEFCRVESHLGAGYVLDMNDEFRKMLSDAWQYYPYDFYTGSYKNSTGEIELYHVFEAESSVHVHIKELSVESKFNSVNSIKLELLSGTDQTVEISLHSAQSDDNLAAGDYREISLTKNKPEAVELSFGGWEYTYWITLTVDNTRVNLRIEP